jgi:hypothetical protein
MTASNVAIGDGAEANSSSVVMKGRSKNSALHNSSSVGMVINDVEIPFSQITGQDVNVQLGGGTSNKNSIVFK